MEVNTCWFSHYPHNLSGAGFDGSSMINDIVVYSEPAPFAPEFPPPPRLDNTFWVKFICLNPAGFIFSVHTGSILTMNYTITFSTFKFHSDEYKNKLFNVYSFYYIFHVKGTENFECDEKYFRFHIWNFNCRCQ